MSLPPGRPKAGSRERTILAFDYGARRIGIAIGNTVTRTARPLQTVSEEIVARRFARIGALLGQWHPDALVVGRPLHPDGTPHQVTVAAERFARQLSGRFGLPVELVDERYSTVEARARREDARLDGRPTPGELTAESAGLDRDDDAAAAAVILEQYLGACAVEGGLAP